MSYVRLINQCSLYVDKVQIFKKIVGAAYIQVRSSRAMPEIHFACCWDSNKGNKALMNIGWSF